MACTVVDLVDLSRHPVVDSHLLVDDRRLVSAADLGRRRLLLAPELGPLFEVHDGVPRVVVHDPAGLRIAIYPHHHADTYKPI